MHLRLPANYVLIHSFGRTSTKWSTISPMDVRMMTLERNHIQGSPHPFHLSQYLPPYQRASNLSISFTQMDQIPQYWPALWFSLGTVCAPLSPVHLTVTSFNPTLVSNSLLMASNTCTNSPHLSTLPATASCENILCRYLYDGDLVFVILKGIYGFKFPKRFLEISSRDLTSSLLFCQS